MGSLSNDDTGKLGSRTVSTKYIKHIGDNAASSSHSNKRWSFVDMGFSPALVDKAIEEHGEDNDELLLETLFKSSVHHKSCQESSDSLDSLFGDKDESGGHINIATYNQLKEEPDVSSGSNAKASLLLMNFPENEVDFIIGKLGADTPLSELVDFISAFQMAENIEKEVSADHYNEGRNKIEDKKHQLREMGFPEQDIVAAIRINGSDKSAVEHAKSIVLGQSNNPSINKVSSSMNFSLTEKKKGKRSIEEFIDNPSYLKKPTTICEDTISPVRSTGTKAKRGISNLAGFMIPLSQGQLCHKAQKDTPRIPKHLCQSLDIILAKPPYFFYGNVLNLSSDSWDTLSRYLYSVEPEFSDTQLYSALSRKEGYIHNLPTNNRYHIIPKSPLTIQEAIPDTRKWWPVWDTRKHISSINAETTGISQQCDKIQRILINSKGSSQQQDFLHQSQTSNLVWVGPNRLNPMEPEDIERILGYPDHHTRVCGISVTDRLQLLKHCFQTDTLGYHISGLKNLFPRGVTVFSVYSGIGGSEIALHRLGIKLKGVVSIEPSETKRRILKQWWNSSGQSGELLQVEDIHMLKTRNIEMLVEKFDGFDIIICQNPSSYSSDLPNSTAVPTKINGSEFTHFSEFVRILHRVRDVMSFTKKWETLQSR